MGVAGDDVAGRPLAEIDAPLAERGVTEVAQEDRELWVVGGPPDGEDLVQTAASVVDAYLGQTRAVYDSFSYPPPVAAICAGDIGGPGVRQRHQILIQGILCGWLRAALSGATCRS